MLGYPPCCVQSRTEQVLQVEEAMIVAFQEQCGAATTEELIRCAEEDVAVSVRLGFRMLDPASTARFPFVSFDASASLTGLLAFSLAFFAAG